MRKMKIFSALTAIMIISAFFPQIASASYFNPPDDIYSSSVYLYNLDTDQVVYAKNENAHIQPASLTKIMTALLVLEHFKDNLEALKTTFVSAPSVAFDEFANQRVSTADFRQYETVSYSDLLYGLLIQSACEASNIIAYNLGNEDMSKFIVMMNEKATELGCTDTNFVNAHGLYDPNQYTTAKDMAKILKYTYENYPLFGEISTAYNYYLSPTDKHSEKRLMIPTNKMLVPTSEYNYPYITSGKTGTLYKDGNTGATDMQNLATTATKDNVSYLLVTMGAPIYNQDGEKYLYHLADQKKLYEWAFNSLSYTKIIDGKSEICDVKVEYGKDADSVNLVTNQDVSLFWPNDLSADKREVITHVDNSIIAPVEKGQKLGSMELLYNGETIAQCDLFASDSVERDNIEYKISVARQFPESYMFKLSLMICIGILILYTVLYFLVNRKKSRNRRRKPIKRSYRR